MTQSMANLTIADPRLSDVAVLSTAATVADSGTLVVQAAQNAASASSFRLRPPTPV